MPVNTPLEPDVSEFSEPIIQARKRRLSLVWLVPVVAALIGGWLIYKTLSEKGPEVTIIFKTAEGLEAGKTKIKFKDVEVGQVTELSLTEDFSQVSVKAQFVKGAEAYLTENTRFWVVRARVAAYGVSGLGTLLSGAYIDIDPGKPGKPELKFNGLEEPPIFTTVDPGRVFTLKADRKGSIDIGAPVYYRQITVGKVIAYHLDPEGPSILFKIFINAPYHQYVHENTRFWNASGFDMKLDTQGIRIQTESFVSLMVGGIAFDIPNNYESPGEAAKEEAVFTLYANRDAAEKIDYAEKKLFLLNFDTSVRGLSPGAPVEFRGIQIGEVINLKLEYDAIKKSFEIPVLIVIEAGRLNLKDNKAPKEPEKVIDYLVAKGFRAQLKTGNLVTGQQYVSLDFFPNAAPMHITYQGEYPVIPTLPTQIEEIASKVGQFIAKLDKLPIDQIGNDLKDTLQGARRITNSPEIGEALHSLNTAVKEIQMLTASLRTGTAPELNAVLKQAKLSLATSKAVLETDSPLQYRMKETLEELSDAARSLRVLVEYLESHPESIVTGKGSEK
ncbi:MAG: MCE family protein [Deltaproteobacteria bacterium]|nr:MCE family protein [Deltaproteobacteria bacterium]